MKGKEVAHSSGRNDWGTPLWLFDYLNKEYKFELDAAASSKNRLCYNYFSEENSALTNSWKGFGNVFVNPPYSLNKQFVAKALDELDGDFSIVMLLPARVDTAYFHDYIWPHATKVTFIRGRLKFQGATAGAPFPSCLVEFTEPPDLSGVEFIPPLIETFDQEPYKNG